jgi:hypothetical protein
MRILDAWILGNKERTVLFLFSKLKRSEKGKLFMKVPSIIKGTIIK